MAITLEQAREVWNRPEGQGRDDSIYAWGQDDQRTDQLAYNMFRQTLGREPTQDEYNQALPYFHGQGAQGRWTGQAFLNQLRQQELQDPRNANSPNNPNNPNNTLGQYTQPVEDVFQELLNRGASEAELNHFRQGLASGQIDAFTLRNFVSQLPEYRERQDQQFRQGLATELEGYDTSAFDKQKQNLLSYYANQGMPAGTSASLDYALTDLMGKIAENRQKFLTGLSADQYGGRTGAARQDYEAYRDRGFGEMDYNRNRSSQMQDYLTGRLGERQDYQQQMQDYENWMNSQKNQPFHTMDWVNMGLDGANTATRFYQGYQSNPYNFLK